MWEIDSLLMSCRVMGRKVEEAFLAYLGEIASARGARILRGLFTPSAKNTPVNRFYLEQGFEQENRPEQAEAQASAYLRKLDRPLLWPTVIRRLQTSL
jgi:predicted enzyme involved in methoxymalonyl-ACP biosynthesis